LHWSENLLQSTPININSTKLAWNMVIILYFMDWYVFNTDQFVGWRLYTLEKFIFWKLLLYYLIYYVSIFMRLHTHNNWLLSLTMITRISKYRFRYNRNVEDIVNKILTFLQLLLSYVMLLFFLTFLCIL